MSWRAVFLDGPLEGEDHDRLMMGAWQERLVFARQLPAGIRTHDGFVLVGAGDFSPIEGSPAVETFAYVRDDDRSQLLECQPARTRASPATDWSPRLMFAEPGTSGPAVTLSAQERFVSDLRRLTEGHMAFAEDLSDMAARVRRATEEFASGLEPDPALIERVRAVAVAQGFTGARAERRLVDGETPAGWFAVATTPGRGDIWHQVQLDEATVDDAWLGAFREIGVDV